MTQPEYTVQGLLPCPFCGTTNVTVCANAIECDDCHAQIIDDEKDEPPIAAWNRRELTAATPAPAAAGDAVRALRRLIDEISVLEEHGGDSDQEDCPICEAIREGEAALANPPPSAPALRTGIQNIGAGDGVEGESGT